MNRIILVILFSISFATIITVDDDGEADYSIIQDALNASIEGDTILVSRGTYEENLIIDKSITLASHVIYDNLSGLDTWTAHNGLRWEVTNQNIAETIIDGSSGTEGYGSCILIYNEDECVESVITGFTIQNGTGTEIIRYYGTENEQIQLLGGGILSVLSNSVIGYNQFLNNGSGDIQEGGAVYASSESEDITFPTRDYVTATSHNALLDDYSISRNRCDIEVFEFSNNLYRDNEALYGKTLSSRHYENEIDMSESIYDIINCSQDDVSSAWVHVESEVETDFEDSEANICATQATDVYVNPNIDQECMDEGCGSENNPFKTITWALQMILPSEDNPITLHLTNGTYSPETGEIFSLILVDYVSLLGEDETLTILDAMQTGRGITIINEVGNLLSEFTITGGLAIGEYPYSWGGGIYCNFSSPTLMNVTIVENVSFAGGGGIYCYDNSSPSLMNVTITENSAFGHGSASGGGIFCTNNSSPSLMNVTITENSAYEGGGGIYCYDNSSPSLENVTITGNASHFGGGISCVNFSEPSLMNVTIAENSSAYGGGIHCRYASPSLENVIITDNSSLYAGGIYCENFSNPSMVNVTITENSAYEGGGIRCQNNSNPSLANSILWNNSPQEIYFREVLDPNSITITYSDIQGGEEGIETNDNGMVYWLDGNINEDPLFTDPNNEDYTLQIDSPCIDAGTADIDGDGEDDILDYFGEAPDMGAFEYNPDELEIEEEMLPINFHLGTPYPNPFNPSTTIDFVIPSYDHISIKLYNVNGQFISTLVDQYYNPGYYQVKWNGSHYSSGVYIVKMISGDFVSAKKIMLIK